MSKEMIVSATSMETKVAIVEDDQVAEILVERNQDKGILGNICKGRVMKVLPGMQAAFVNIGLERDAFLYVTDFLEDYEEYEEFFAEVKENLEPSEDGPWESAEVEEKKLSPKTRGRKTGQRQAKASLPEGNQPEEAPPATQLRNEPANEPPEVVPQSPQPLLESGQILVSTFPVAAPPDTGEQQGDEGPASTILPEHLETIAHFEPENPEQRTLPDRGARIQDKGDLKRLTTRRGEPRRRKRRPSKQESDGRALIGDLLREGQEILVQVAKEPIARKGARITSHIALPGRYLVFMPTVDHVGVSRKIVSEEERQRLRDIILKLAGNSGKGFIVRTVGENHTEEDFKQDMTYLTQLWTEIRSKAEKISAPALVHSEPNLLQRVLRDYLNRDYRVVRVDDEKEYENIVKFVNQISPELVDRIRLYTRRKPIFDEYGVSAETEKALKQKVWLKNGGYIAINQTEALVAVDVNTGKFVGRTNSLEDTITKTNLDAVREVVRQIRLRNLGGIIVIDFIDMDERRNRQKVMEALQLELSKDKSPSRILQFNEFGLVSITRRRVRPSLEKTLCQPCGFCQGTGMIKSVRTVCYSIEQEVRGMRLQLGNGNELLIRCHPDVGKALRDGERAVLAEIEEITKKVVSIKSDPLMHIEHFELVES